ncbi:MAG: hypothetical protein WA843_04240, partial [Candidatus Saccharimonadales bacterium]
TLNSLGEIIMETSFEIDKAMAQAENIRLGGWLQKITDIHDSLLAVTQDGSRYEFGGFRPNFVVHPSLAIEVHPSESVILGGLRVMSEQARPVANDRQYTQEEPFVDGKLLQARLRSGVIKDDPGSLALH